MTEVLMRFILMFVALSSAVASSACLAWDVRSNEDQMSGEVITTAYLMSTNAHRFDRPYHRQDQRGWLTVREHPRLGKDVMFNITGGQIICRVSGCHVLVRFDDNKPIKFDAIGPEDHDPKIVFIQNPNQFITKLKKAKRVRIAATIYHEGEPVFEFDVRGYPLK